jgi:hypothetical protein
MTCALAVPRENVCDQRAEINCNDGSDQADLLCALGGNDGSGGDNGLSTTQAARITGSTAADGGNGNGNGNNGGAGCARNEWGCSDGKECIQKTFRCDGFHDCADSSDEDLSDCADAGSSRDRDHCDPRYSRWLCVKAVLSLLVTA